MSSKTVYDFDAVDIDGNPVSLGDYRGKVLLIVNVASKCGLTPQYEGLQKLHAEYSDKGFSVLGFPCNQFLGQEPGTSEEIKTFCQMEYNANFPLFEKIDVNGDDTHPLFEFLKAAQPGLLGSKGVKWNFTKFLVDRDGNPVKRFAPKTTPSELVSDVEQALA